VFQVALLATGLGLLVTASHAGDRLPLPDGSYASKPEFCKMGKERAYQVYEYAFYDIQGSEISNYETFCSVRDVRVKGKTIRFLQVCESEGEASSSQTVWTKLGRASFKDASGRVWTGCGRFVD
jgi:hypothetical protein